MNNELLDKIYEKLHQTEIHLAKIQVDLQHHIRRSESNEKRLDKFEADHTKFKAWVAMGGWITATAIALLGIFVQ